MASMLLPIRKILYEDDSYFVYSQECVRILDLAEVDYKVILKILEIVKTMFQNQVLTCDLISSNFGWAQDNQLYLLDYHDMKPVSDFIQKNRWSKIVRCLIEYFSWWLFHKSFEAHTSESMLEWKSETTIVKKQFGANYFPPYLVDLLRSFSATDPQKIIDNLNRCHKIVAASASSVPLTSSIHTDDQRKRKERDEHKKREVDDNRKKSENQKEREKLKERDDRKKQKEQEKHKTSNDSREDYVLPTKQSFSRTSVPTGGHSPSSRTPFQ